MLSAGERMIHDTRVVRNDATGAVDLEDGQGRRMNVVTATTDAGIALSYGGSFAALGNRRYVELTGNSTTDTANLRDAIGIENRGTIEVMGDAGTYTIDDTLLIASGVKLVTATPFTFKAAAGLNKALLSNLHWAVSEDSNIFVEGPFTFDLDYANQTAPCSCIDFHTARKIYFSGGVGAKRALRTEAFPATSGKGEGFLFQRCYEGVIRDCWAEDNTYDGFKTRWSADLQFQNIRGKNNGRSTLQISYESTDGGTPTTTHSSRIHANGVITVHDTGTPTAVVSPVTAGLYFHGAQKCVASNVITYGTQQGIGFTDCSDNSVIGGHQAIRYDSGVASSSGISFDSAGCARNVVTNQHLRPLSGANGRHVNFIQNCTYNTVDITWGSAGAGSGTWTIQVRAGAYQNTIKGTMIGTITDSGTGTFKTLLFTAS